MLSSAARNRKYLGLHHENVDSKIKFTIEPLPGDDAFDQWKDAMKAVAGLSMGIPVDYRKKVWLALADNYLNGLCIDWEKTVSLAFNRKSNPDDNKLDQQIVKDLHRTGCSGFSGHDNDEDRAVLQRVLLAYARWNKQVGYCQGFNVIAALILDVMDRQEDCALKVMIYLIDRVLPESYFANNLRALSVDMAVFRHLLRLQLPKFARHLDRLQASSADQSTGASYEPPLTDVFTMQWFLTLFATCLPKSTALRIWDAVLLEGSEVLLKTAVGIWGTLQQRLFAIQSPDEFYTAMGSLSQEMLDGTVIDEDALIQTVYDMSSSSATVKLNELRQAYSKRLAAAMSAAGNRWLSVTSFGNGGGGGGTSGDDDLDIDINCFSGMLPFPQQLSPQRSGTFNRSDSNTSLSDMQSSGGFQLPTLASVDKMALDVNLLNKQYAKLQERQKQARIILAGAHQNRSSTNLKSASPDSHQLASSVAVNHLYIGREMSVRNRLTPARSPVSSVQKSPSRLGLQSCSSSSSGGDHEPPTSSSVNEVVQASPRMSQSVIVEAAIGFNGTPNDEDTAATSGWPSLQSESAEQVVAAGRVPSSASSSDAVSILVSQVVAANTNSSKQDEQISLKNDNAFAKFCMPTSSLVIDARPNDNSLSRQQTPQCHAYVNEQTTGSAMTSSSHSKAFNPFPKQYVSSQRRRTENSIRLGLYAAPSGDGGGRSSTATTMSLGSKAR